MTYPNGTTLAISDGTGNQTGTNHGATATEGQIDGGASVVSASSQYIDYGLFTSSAATTISAWVKGTTFPNAYNTVGGWAASGPSVEGHIFVKSNGKLAIFIQTGTGSTVVSYDGTGSHTLSTGTFYLLHATYNSSAGLVGYVNGASDNTAAANGVCAAGRSASLYVGNDPLNAGRFWNGVLDQVTFASVARSADWITTEYNNQSAPAAFGTLLADSSRSRATTFGG
jgi:hypothetical protein